MNKKYYDGIIVTEILLTHLEPEKMLEVLTAFAEAKGVDAVPVRHGCWSEHKDYHGIAWLCSECGYFTTMRSYHYCPNCGARMDKDETD